MTWESSGNSGKAHCSVLPTIVSQFVAELACQKSKPKRVACGFQRAQGRECRDSKEVGPTEGRRGGTGP